MFLRGMRSFKPQCNNITETDSTVTLNRKYAVQRIWLHIYASAVQAACSNFPALRCITRILRTLFMKRNILTLRHVTLRCVGNAAIQLKTANTSSDLNQQCQPCQAASTPDAHINRYVERRISHHSPRYVHSVYLQHLSRASAHVQLPAGSQSNFVTII